MMNRRREIDGYLREFSGSIYLWNMRITNEEVEYICSKTDGPSSREINFSNVHRSQTITHESILHISQLEWNTINLLNLSNNNIGDKGCKYLTKTHMPSLQKVYLNGNNIGNTGGLHFSKGAWPQLKTLSVSIQQNENDKDWMRVEGYAYLIRGNWRGFKTILMNRPGLAQEQVRMLLLCQFVLNSIQAKNREVRLLQRAIQSCLKSKFPQVTIKA